MKRCSQCGEEKPIDAYYLDKGKPRASCKACHKAKVAALRDADREQHNAKRRAARAKNPEHYRAATRGWIETNRESYNARRRADRAANPEKYREQKRQTWERHKDRINAERRKAWLTDADYRARKRAWDAANRARVLDAAKAARYRRRVLLEAAYVEDVPFDTVLLRDLGTCGICGQQIMETTIELDHIVPLTAGGRHELANVQLSHRSCNRRKFTRVGFSLVA